MANLPTLASTPRHADASNHHSPIASPRSPLVQQTHSPRDQISILPPEVLELSDEDGMIISSQNAPERPIYSLSHPIIGARTLQYNSNNGSNGHRTIFSRHYYADPSKPNGPTPTIPQPLFCLYGRTPVSSPFSSAASGSNSNTYYLARIAGNMPGNIEFEGPFASTSTSTPHSPFPQTSTSSLPPPPPLSITTTTTTKSHSCTSINVHLHPGKTDSDANPFSPEPVFFLHMRTRWLRVDEYNFLDTEGRQVACEEVGVGGKTRRLVVTRAMPVVLRECLVAIWCLRMWMSMDVERSK